jgi:hypothetical protein
MYGSLTQTFFAGYVVLPTNQHFSRKIFMFVGLPVCRRNDVVKIGS